MLLPEKSTACTADRWRARACSHQGRIYLRVRCPPVVTAVSPARTPSWTLPIVTEEEKRGKHRSSRMGFYGTLKMIFYKVSRITGGDDPPVSPLTRLPSRFHIRYCASRRPAYLWHADLCRDCGGCGEVEQPPGDAALIARAYMAFRRRCVRIKRRGLTHDPFYCNFFCLKSRRRCASCKRGYCCGTYGYLIPQRWIKTCFYFSCFCAFKGLAGDLIMLLCRLHAPCTCVAPVLPSFYMLCFYQFGQSVLGTCTFPLF